MKVTLLAGGVGAARLLRGLVPLVDAESLTVVVNVGDDDEFYGLHVSPDIDTIVYTLAGLAPRGRGWGIRGDGRRVLEQLEGFYGPSWFALGDRDLATHIYRTDHLRRGGSLTDCTHDIAGALGVKVRVLPATDDRLRTLIQTDGGTLAFQTYLVRDRARPLVRGVRYEGAAEARPAPGVLDAIEAADAVLIAPSNPFVSIGPMLAVPGIRRALTARRERTVAVSPLIRGAAVKGPLAAMLAAMGRVADSSEIASIYGDVAGTLVVAPGDGPGEPGTIAGMRIVEHETLLDRIGAAKRLARFMLTLAAEGAGGQARSRA